MRTVCPFCHIVMFLMSIEARYAFYQCPACGYRVLVDLAPVPVVCVYWKEKTVLLGAGHNPEAQRPPVLLDPRPNASSTTWTRTQTIWRSDRHDRERAVWFAPSRQPDRQALGGPVPVLVVRPPATNYWIVTTQKRCST
jgi:DNA-directed RNA polymerase subunit RPC12/RpoP